MKESRIRRGKPAIAGVIVVVLFLPMVGAITDTGQGVAYGQARDPALERYASAECVKLRRDLSSAEFKFSVYEGHVN